MLKLEDEREKPKNKLYPHQQLIFKTWFDEKSSTNRAFEVGDLVLKWEKFHKYKNYNTKFQHLWLGPFTIIENIGPGIFWLETLEGFPETYPVNIKLLKKYRV